MTTDAPTTHSRSRKEKKPEPTEEEKFILSLEQDVSTFLTIHRAAYFGYHKTLQKRIDEKAQVDALEPESGNTPLILASRNGCLKAAELLLDKGGAQVNLAGFGGLTALHHAALNDRLGVLEALLERRAHVNAEDDAGNTPALLAARMGSLRCLEALADKGANVELANKRGVAPFGAAILNGRVALVDWFLKRGVDVQHADHDGNTVLHYAAQCGYARVVRQLLDANCRADVQNALDETPGDLAPSDAIRALLGLKPLQQPEPEPEPEQSQPEPKAQPEPKEEAKQEVEADAPAEAESKAEAEVEAEAVAEQEAEAKAQLDDSTN